MRDRFKKPSFSANHILERNRDRRRRKRHTPGQPVWFVSPHRDGWAVQRKGSSRATSVHQTKSAAVRKGKKLARRNNGQLRVQKKNGKFGYERTYGHDPESSPR